MPADGQEAGVEAYRDMQANLSMHFKNGVVEVDLTSIIEVYEKQ